MKCLSLRCFPPPLIFSKSKQLRHCSSYPNKFRNIKLNTDLQRTSSPICDEQLTKEYVRRIVLEPKALRLQLPSYVPLKRTKPKRHVLLLSYCGRNYFGMQMHRPTHSNDRHGIEDYLITAAVKAELLDSRCLVIPALCSFQKASRTDKRVSAARQVVALNLPHHIPDETIAEMINEYLPPDIRVFGVSKVNKEFDPRKMCNGRSYSYLCPSYAFAPIDQICNKNYRITSEQINEVDKLFKLFHGQHNFHNYTAKLYFRDKSCTRVIYSIKMDPPFERNGNEWIRINVKGQSFILHQIRKIIGTVMIISKSIIPEVYIPLAWTEKKLGLPKAPGLGLVLENQSFKNYNSYCGNNPSRKQIDWSGCNKKVLDFREKFIDLTIIEEEIETCSMLKWLSTTSVCDYIHRSACDGIEE